MGPPVTGNRYDLDALKAAIAESAVAVDAALDRMLPPPHGRQARVQEAMRYAIQAGGKRLRPFLVLQAARLFAVPDARALRVGAAIEALHTYSLVHDDLPCMDDDALRRGRPTTHIAFDEMTAVLAGDALLTIAFEFLAEAETHPNAEVRCALALRLAQAAGHVGMIGGQIIDMLAPTFVKEGSFGIDAVIELQRKKTGQLFEFSCEAGPILGEAPGEDRRSRRRLGRTGHNGCRRDSVIRGTRGVPGRNVSSARSRAPDNDATVTAVVVDEDGHGQEQDAQWDLEAGQGDRQRQAAAREGRQEAPAGAQVEQAHPPAHRHHRDRGQ